MRVELYGCLHGTVGGIYNSFIIFTMMIEVVSTFL